MATSTAVTIFDQKMAAFKGYLKTQMPVIRAACPSGVEANTIVRTMVNAIHGNPDLVTKCDHASLGLAVLKAATYGLEIADGQLGHAYIVPYGTKAQLQLSYKGIKELVRRSGQGFVVMGEVREGDQFEDFGAINAPLHKKSNDPKRHEKKLTHAYAVMRFNNNLTISRVMSVDECIAHRDRYSKTWQSAVSRQREKEESWHEKSPNFPKMCMKTCVHALANDGDLPLSAEMRGLLADKDASPSNTFEQTTTELPPANTNVLPPPAPTEEPKPNARIFADLPADELPTADMIFAKFSEATTTDECTSYRHDMYQELEGIDDLIALVDEAYDARKIEIRGGKDE